MNLLDLKIGTSIRKLIVKDINKELIVKDKNNELKEMYKVIFKVNDDYTNNNFNISDAWVQTNTGIQIKGLWLALQNNGDEILKTSTLAKVLKYYNVNTLKDLIGQTVYVYPDSKNFLVLVACDMNEIK